MSVLSVFLAMAVLAGDPPADQPPSAPAAATGANTTASPSGKKVKSPDDVICKAPQVTGSKIPGKKVCLTRREWDQQTKDARDILERTPVPAAPGG